jgi:hypothetical protein
MKRTFFLYLALLPLKIMAVCNLALSIFLRWANQGNWFKKKKNLQTNPTTVYCLLFAVSPFQKPSSNFIYSSENKGFAFALCKPDAQTEYKPIVCPQKNKESYLSGGIEEYRCLAVDKFALLH